MARLVFAPKAISDTYAILRILDENAGRAVAQAYFDRFKSIFERLALFPQSGAPRPRLGASVRIAVVRPYIVIYRVRGE